MYNATQTLRHKEQDLLARINPVEVDSAWAWTRKETRMLSEDGMVFVDDLDNWTHIEDEFGDPQGGFTIKEGEFVDTSLRRFLVPEEELATMREEFLVAKLPDILQMLQDVVDKKQYKHGEASKYTYTTVKVTGPWNCGGGHKKRTALKNRFIQEVGATPIYSHRVWNFNTKAIDEMTGPMFFRRLGHLWVIPVGDPQCIYLVESLGEGVVLGG